MTKEEREKAITVLIHERECVIRASTEGCNRNCGKCDLVLDESDILSVYDKLLEEIEQEPKWIPVSERLPEEYGEYLITWTTSMNTYPHNAFIAICEYEVTSEYDHEHYRFKGEWLLDDYIKNYPDVKVIAWMPLPEPYKAESEG